MKIVQKLNKPPTTTFRDISPGEVFKAKPPLGSRDENWRYYLKAMVGSNSTNLETGSTRSFSSDQPVVALEASLHVKNKPW